MVNLELYKVFYQVAKSGSLTKASEQLFISQPAVSQAIKQLEQQIGGKLFLRTPKGMQLTKEGGEMIFPYIEKAMMLLDEAEDRFKQTTTTAVGNVKIGASDTVCKNYLLPYIKRFNRKYKDVKIQVTNRTTNETIELLKNGEVDMGFVNLPIEENGDIQVIENCSQLNDIFVASKDFVDIKETIKLKDLDEYPLLMLELASNTRRSITDYCASMGIHLHPEIELGSLDLLVDFAKIGMGIACVPRQYVEKELKEGTLYEVKTEPTLPERYVGLIVNNKKYLNYAVKEFIKFIRE